jgi:hypothetical protein
LEIKNRVNRIISFIKWKGATFESKEKKIIKELSLIKDYSLSCLPKDTSINQLN